MPSVCDWNRKRLIGEENNKNTKKENRKEKNVILLFLFAKIIKFCLMGYRLRFPLHMHSSMGVFFPVSPARNRTNNGQLNVVSRQIQISTQVCGETNKNCDYFCYNASCKLIVVIWKGQRKRKITSQCRDLRSTTPRTVSRFCFKRYTIFFSFFFLEYLGRVLKNFLTTKLPFSAQICV